MKMQTIKFDKSLARFHCKGGGGGTQSKAQDQLTLMQRDVLADQLEDTQANRAFTRPIFEKSLTALADAADEDLTTGLRDQAVADANMASGRALEAVAQKTDLYGANLNPDAQAARMQMASLEGAKLRADAANKATVAGRDMEYQRKGNLFNAASGQAVQNNNSMSQIASGLGQMAGQAGANARAGSAAQMQMLQGLGQLGAYAFAADGGAIEHGRVVRRKGFGARRKKTACFADGGMALDPAQKLLSPSNWKENALDPLGLREAVGFASGGVARPRASAARLRGINLGGGGGGEISTMDAVGALAGPAALKLAGKHLIKPALQKAGAAIGSAAKDAWGHATGDLDMIADAQGAMPGYAAKGATEAVFQEGSDAAVNGLTDASTDAATNAATDTATQAATDTATSAAADSTPYGAILNAGVKIANGEDVGEAVGGAAASAAGAKLGSVAGSALGPVGTFAGGLIGGALGNITASLFNEGGEAREDHRPGGAVEGPGSEVSDSIPAWLSDGEVVNNAESVKMPAEETEEVIAQWRQEGGDTKDLLLAINDAGLEKRKQLRGARGLGRKIHGYLNGGQVLGAIGAAATGFVPTAMTLDRQRKADEQMELQNQRLARQEERQAKLDAQQADEYKFKTDERQRVLDLRTAINEQAAKRKAALAHIENGNFEALAPEIKRYGVANGLEGHALNDGHTIALDRNGNDWVYHVADKDGNRVQSGAVDKASARQMLDQLYDADADYLVRQYDPINAHKTDVASRSALAADQRKHAQKLEEIALQNAGRVGAAAVTAQGATDRAVLGGMLRGARGTGAGRNGSGGGGSGGGMKPNDWHAFIPEGGWSLPNPADPKGQPIALAREDIANQADRYLADLLAAQPDLSPSEARAAALELVKQQVIDKTKGPYAQSDENGDWGRFAEVGGKTYRLGKGPLQEGEVRALGDGAVRGDAELNLDQRLLRAQLQKASQQVGFFERLDTPLQDPQQNAARLREQEALIRTKFNGSVEKYNEARNEAKVRFEHLNNTKNGKLALVPIKDQSGRVIDWGPANKSQPNDNRVPGGASASQAGGDPRRGVIQRLREFSESGGFSADSAESRRPLIEAKLRNKMPLTAAEAEDAARLGLGRSH